MSDLIYDRMLKGESKLAVIGLGYVGLPIALDFARKIKVVGFDINQERVDLMKNNVDPSNELETKDFEGCDILFTANIDDLKDVEFFIVAVPTPIDDANLPDLSPLLGASKTVSQVLKKGDYVVYESTVYPGCTEEDCIPVLEKGSGLKFQDDFKVGYSPERINPGDKVHTLQNVVKVSSGCCAESSEEIAKTYELVVGAGVHRAPNIKVAEAAKIIENTQRDVNIALINELSIIFNKLNINTFDVLEAAGTKWNFLKFSPGLVGGHCIGVDPYYLIHKSKKSGFIPHLMNTSRETNNYIPEFISKKLNSIFEQNEKNISKTDVLILGYTFKENCDDIRNSKVLDIETKLTDYGYNVDIYDPLLKNNNKIIKDPFKSNKKYDGIILAVSHNNFCKYTEDDFNKISKENLVLLDIKGMYSFATWKF